MERYQRILAEELLYAREFTSEDARAEAIGVWNIHYNYHRPHSGADGRPPASRLPEGVTNVQPLIQDHRGQRDRCGGSSSPCSVQDR